MAVRLKEIQDEAVLERLLPGRDSRDDDVRRLVNADPLFDFRKTAVHAANQFVARAKRIAQECGKWPWFSESLRQSLREGRKFRREVKSLFDATLTKRAEGFVSSTGIRGTLQKCGRKAMEAFKRETLATYQVLVDQLLNIEREHLEAQTSLLDGFA